MIKRYKKNKSVVSEDHSYWISFSDIMSGLLIVFILACLGLLLELMSTKKKVDMAITKVQQAESLKRLVLNEVKENLKKNNIIVEISYNKSVLRIPDSLLAFDSNSYDIPQNEKMKKSLDIIGKELYRALSKENRTEYFDTIFIEGHTDHRPTSRTYGNLGLSTFRAISIWKFWTEKKQMSLNLDGLKNSDGRPLFSVSGYGKTRPLDSKELDENLLKINRRIDIRFTVKKPVIKDYEKILEIL